MKIGIDIRNIGKKRTGDEVVFFNLVKNLAVIDGENEYYLFTDIQEEAVLEEIKGRLKILGKKNFSVISLKTGNKFIWNIWALPKYLRKFPVDIYQTQYIVPFFMPKKTKIITIIHDISFNFFPQLIKFTDLIFLKLLIPFSLKKADKIIAVSQFTKDEIIKYYQISPEKIEWINNAIGDEFLKREYSMEELKAARKKYNLPEKFILYLGTLQPRKNLPFLIEAFVRVKDRLSGAKLVLAGSKNSHNFDRGICKIIDLLGVSKDVVFPGFIGEDDKAKIYKMADIFVFPSLYEGFGIPVLEAMSQGVPAVVSDIPCLREVAREAAIYFDPRTLVNLEEKLYTVFKDKDLREKMVQLGFKRIQFFSWRKTAEKMLIIYNNVINFK